MRLALIGLSVAGQRAEMRRLEAVGRVRALNERETGLLAELVRLEAERDRHAVRRQRFQRERALAVLARVGIAA